MEHRGPPVTHTFKHGQPDEVSFESGPVYPISAPVTIKNASPLPVFLLDVELYAVHPTDGYVLAGAYQFPHVVVGEFHMVEIMTPQMVESVIGVLNDVPGSDRGPSQLRIGWSFEDIAGVRWRREPDGLLVEVPRD